MGRQPLAEPVICETCKRIPAGIVRPMQSSPCFFRRQVVMDGAAPAFDSNGRLPPSLCSGLRGFSPHLLLFPGGKKVLFFYPFLFFQNFLSFSIFFFPERGMELDVFQRTRAATDI
ncbi:hypothetical protein CEXT_587991 [Caerostris extrusa]|uniref:Transmembrane protein n=1 Tax=Caerostris extrusa TaxID=172846 RepID=A0AAV4VLU2_CAEEX|nr:hypothetical protein CEXT_587991 [Caerostris extrusa]